MGNSMESPKVEKDSEVYTSRTGLVCGGSGMQGWRVEMEDSHIAIDIPSKPDHLFLGVWDGHAGAGAAKYAHDNVISFLEQTEEWKEYIRGEKENPELVGRAMIATFLMLDEKMKIYQQTTNGHDTSGCTSVTAMVTPKYIICANAGDSRCVMGIAGSAKPLSFDHKPSLPLERERVDAAGGFVQWNRVDGDLAVSRALGDFGYKNRPDLPPEKQKVSPYPDINVHERQETDDLLLLACDGLWDVMTNSEAVAQVRELFQTGETSVVKIAEEMLDVSLNKGSKDNISAMLVKLPGAVLGPESNGGVDKIRQLRTGYALNDIDDTPTPAFTLTSAPNPSAAAAAALASTLRQVASENPNELEISADSAAFLEEVMRGIASDISVSHAHLIDNQTEDDEEEEAADAAAIAALEADDVKKEKEEEESNDHKDHA